MRKIWLRDLLRRPDEGSGGGSGNGSEPSGPAATPEPSPPSGRETQIGTIPADIMSLFDGEPQAQPPAPPEEGGEPPSPTPPPSTQPVAPQPGQTPQPGAPQPQASPAAAPAAPDPAVLAGQVQTLTQLVSRQIAQGQPPTSPQAPAEPELPAHQYQMTIPDGLDVALISDDPVVRKQAIGALVQGTAQTVHREVVKSMRQEFSRALPAIIQRHIAESRQQSAVAQDFYGTFPQYAHPAFKPIVVQLAQQVAAETGARTWSVELRNKVGERLNQLVAAVAGQQPPNGGVQPQPGPTLPPQGPAAIQPGGARPSMGADPHAQFRELLS